MKFQQLGWVMFSALLAVVLAGGFTQATEKVGVVDIAKIVEKSDFGVANADTYAKMKASREGLLEFIDTNRVLTTEQAQRLRDLALKPQPTPEEKAEQERIRADVIAANKKWQEISTKANISPEERTLLDEYSRRSQSMNEYAQRLLNQFANEMQDWANQQKLKSIDRARTAIKEVATTQGFNIVFEVGVAPFGANDLSDAALVAMNAKK